jgi:hypothetical protein
MDNTAIKILHEWTVNIKRQVEETGPETINGQTVQVTRKVDKETLVKFAIKLPTRKELKAAELFYGKEFNRFFSMGFIPKSILINKHMDLSGGIMSEKERNHIAELVKKSVDLEADLIRITVTGENKDLKGKIEAKLATIKSEIVNLQIANESVFSQTADAKAQSQLNTWFALFLVLTEKNGKWHPYFEGETFEQKEEAMWKLEEDQDDLYKNAVESISKHTNIFISGGDTPEKFKLALNWLDKEAASQLASSENLENKETNIKTEVAADTSLKIETPPVTEENKPQQ